MFLTWRGFILFPGDVNYAVHLTKPDTMGHSEIEESNLIPLYLSPL